MPRFFQRFSLEKKKRREGRDLKMIVEFKSRQRFRHKRGKELTYSNNLPVKTLNLLLSFLITTLFQQLTPDSTDVATDKFLIEVSQVSFMVKVDLSHLISSMAHINGLCFLTLTSVTEIPNNCNTNHLQNIACHILQSKLSLRDTACALLLIRLP